jgi:hypothetical protein
MNAEGRKTNMEVIEEYLKDHPEASKGEIAAATGRKIHSPDLTKVRKKMGLTWSRGGPQRARKGKAQAAPFRPRFQARTVTDNGVTLILGVAELSKTYGAANVAEVAKALAEV